jgi:hypothetical protein
MKTALARAAMIALLAVNDVSASHIVGAEAPDAWRVQLAKVEQALDGNDLAQAALLWRDAYAAALRSRHWQGMVAVADAYRRLGDLGGFREASRSKACESYRAGLFRARQEESLDGVLRVAEAFAELDDRGVVEQCIRIARSIAAQGRDANGVARVRGFAERWEARTLEVGRRDGPAARGAIR